MSPPEEAIAVTATHAHNTGAVQAAKKTKTLHSNLGFQVALSMVFGVIVGLAWPEFAAALPADRRGVQAPCNISIGRMRRIGSKKGRRLSRERGVKLKEGSVPGIGVGEQNRVR